MKNLLFSCVLLASLLVLGCEKAPQVARVTTEVHPTELVAGEAAEVTCTLKDGSGATIKGKTVFAVSPLGGTKIDGNKLIANYPGTYSVTCQAPDFPEIGGNAAEINVESNVPERVRALLSATRTKVGEPVDACCEVTNANGHILDVPTRLMGSQCLSVEDGMQVWSLQSGYHEVTCEDDVNAGLRSPVAILYVEPGAITTIDVSLEPFLAEYVLGTDLSYSAKGRDAHGNFVEAVAVTPSAPEGIVVVDGTNVLRAQKVGTHTVTFSAKGADGAEWATEVEIVVAGAEVEVPDDQVRLDIPYVPTAMEVVNHMIKMGGVAPGDVVYDLGCGDGRQVITAAKRFGTRGVGVDIDPVRVAESKANALKEKVEHLVTFRRENLFETSFTEASVMLMYLLPEVNISLRPKILSELKPGSRIVSHDFHMGDWEPDDSTRMDSSAEVNHDIFMWVIPARVEDDWTWKGPSLGEGEAVLELWQAYQVIEGSLRVGKVRYPIVDGVIKGTEVHFSVAPTVGGEKVLWTLQGTVADGRITGTLKSADGSEQAWEAEARGVRPRVAKRAE